MKSSIQFRFVAALAVAGWVFGLVGGCARRDDAGPEIAAWARVHPAEELHSVGCGECHAAAAEAWHRSDHAVANREVDPQVDASMFAGQTASTHGADFTFVTGPEGAPLIRETRRDGSVHEHVPDMVIARRPLWQYLVALEPGRWQATEVAWDPEKQEWFSVFGAEERNPGEWGHWGGRGMNWNSMCARCHVTGYARNYDATTDRYHSRWLEHGIGCVQCHGALPAHDEQRALPPGHDAMAGDRARAMETCAACHSRAESLTPGAPVPGARFDDHFRLQLPVEPGLYFPDGQIRDEVFVYGSFRHSRMGAAGVTCVDCHNAHSGATHVPATDNLLCMQCHATGGTLRAPVIDPTAHSRHGADSTGNRCVECHMVETTYMQRDPRRDHGFIIPDPVLTRDLGVPNACSRCHADQTLDWNINHYENWYGDRMRDSRHRARARAVAAAYDGDDAALRPLLELLATETVPAWRASLLTLADRVVPGDATVFAAAREQLGDPDALVRAAAVRALATDPSATPLLDAALQNPTRLVRVDAAWARSPQLLPDSPERRELDAYLGDTLDQPAGVMRWAQDLHNRHRTTEAIDTLRPALAWDPLSPGLRQALGMMLSVEGRSREAAEMLDQAAKLAPADASLAFMAALGWSEARDPARAEVMFREAVQRDPRFARAWYNLGLLLAQTGRPSEALASLTTAGELAPAEPDAPYARATVLAQLGRRDEAIAAVNEALARRAGFQPARELLEVLRAGR